MIKEFMQISKCQTGFQYVYEVIFLPIYVLLQNTLRESIEFMFRKKKINQLYFLTIGIL